MPRIIVFGKSKRRTKTTTHVVRAFRERGNETVWLNPYKVRRRKKNEIDKWILKQLDSFNPDIVFIYSKDIPLTILQKIAGSTIKTVMYYEDWSPEVSPSLAEKGKLVDFFLTTNKGMHREYRQAGITNPIYFVGACDRYDHRRSRPGRSRRPRRRDRGGPQRSRARAEEGIVDRIGRIDGICS